MQLSMEKSSILIVDDEELNLYFLREALQYYNLQIKEATNGQKADFYTLNIGLKPRIGNLMLHANAKLVSDLGQGAFGQNTQLGQMFGLYNKP